MTGTSASEEAHEHLLALYAALSSILSSGLDDVSRRLAEETMKEAADYLAPIQRLREASRTPTVVRPGRERIP